MYSHIITYVPTHECISSTADGRMHSPPRGVTRQRCGLLPNYLGYLLKENSYLKQYLLLRSNQNDFGALIVVQAYCSNDSVIIIGCSASAVFAIKIHPQHLCVPVAQVFELVADRFSGPSRAIDQCVCPDNKINIVNKMTFHLYILHAGSS